MLFNLIFVFVFFIEMLISCIFFGNISERKYSLLATLCIGTVIFELGAILNIFVINNAYLNALFSILATFTLATICFNIKKLKSLFYSVILIAINTLLEIIAILINLNITQEYMSADYQSKVFQSSTEIVLSKALYFICVMLIMRFIKNDNNAKIKIPISFYIYPITAIVISLGFWIICCSEHVEYKHQVLLAVLSIILFVTTILMFFAFQANAQKENKMILIQQEQEKIKTDISYYDILEKQNTNLRSYAHDARNHLSAIKSLNTDPEIDTYVSKMIESLKEYSNVSHSGNRILDIIIDKYVTECNINGINFLFDVKINNLAGLEYHDTVTILGNLLDNAIEAALKSEEKNITFETDYRNNYSVIIISNSCDTQPNFDSSKTPITTKSNKVLHGFGLRSVKKTIKKYDGDIALEYDADNRLFIVTIMLDLNHKK